MLAVGSFEEAINSALFNQLILLAISKPPAIGPNGTPMPLEYDVAYTEVARMYAGKDVRKKLDFVAKARFRMYSRGGELQALAKLTAVEQFAKWTHKALARLPESALSDIDTRLADEITDSLSSPSRRRTFSFVSGTGVPSGGGGANVALDRLGAAATSIASAARVTALDVADRARMLVGGPTQSPASVKRSQSSGGERASARSISHGAGSTSIAVFAGDDGPVLSQPESRQVTVPLPAIPEGGSPRSLSSSLEPRRASRALTAHTFVDPAAPSPWAAQGLDLSLPVKSSYGELLPSKLESSGAGIQRPSSPTAATSVPEHCAQSIATGIAVPKATRSARAHVTAAPAPVAPVQLAAHGGEATHGRADWQDGGRLLHRASVINRLRGGRGHDVQNHAGVPPTGTPAQAQHPGTHTDDAVLDSVNSTSHLASVGRNVGRVFQDVLRSTLRAGLAATLSPDDLEAAVANGLIDRSMVVGLTPSLTPPLPHADDATPSSGAATSAPASDATAEAAPPKPPPVKLRAAHIAACIADSADAQRAFGLLDKNGDGFVEREELVEIIAGMFRDWTSLKRALRGNHSVSTAMQFLLDCAFWVLLASVMLWLFNVPVVQVYIPLGTVLVSASFAIGSSVSNVISALIFVLIMRPYQVGDRVTCSDVLGGQETLLVQQVCEVLGEVSVRNT